MSSNASTSPAQPTTLALLLRQAADELQAQPAPPLPAAVLGVLPATAQARPALAGVTAGAGQSPRLGAGNGWLAALWGPRLATAGVALSLLLVAATALLLMGGSAREREMTLASRHGGAAAGFVPVAPQERWLRLADDGGAAWVVATEIAPQRLAQWGLPFDPTRAADPVRAELLMRASGEVLAVRVID